MRSREFTSGSWVWMYSPRRYVGRSPKWQRNYSGPFLVIRRLSFVLYVVQRSRRAKEIVVHGDKLKLYLEPAPDSWGLANGLTVVVEGTVSTSAEPSRSPRSHDQDLELESAKLGPNKKPLTCAPQSSSGIVPVVGPSPSSLSPLAAEFRPKRQIKLPRRYQ